MSRIEQVADDLLALDAQAEECRQACTARGGQ